MSVFKPFVFDAGVSDDVFNEEVSGNNYLPKGPHTVTIKSVDPGAYEDGAQFIDILLEDDEGKSYKERVNLGAQPDKKDPTKMTVHFNYKRLCNLLPMDEAEDFDLRKKFFGNWFVSDAKHLGAIIGMKADITIIEGWKGYTVKEDDLGGKYLYDVKTKERIVSKPPIFESYDDAHANAEAILNIKPAYNQLGTLTPATPEENRQQAKDAMANGVAAPKQINRQTM